MFRSPLCTALFALLFTASTLADAGTDWAAAIEAGKKAYAQRQYDEAQKQFELAVKAAETFGEKDTRLAAALDHLGTVHSVKREFTTAEPLFKRAIQIIENAYDEGHPDLIGTLQSLATLYRATNKLDDAQALYERTLTICEAAFGKEDERVATALHNLAALHGMRNQYAKSLEYLERALAIREAKLGEGDPSVHTTLTDMGNTCFRLGRHDDAAKHYKRALKLIETQQKGKPAHVDAMNRLAQLYDAQRKWNESLPLYQEGLTILEQNLGVDHAAVGQACFKLASTHAAMEKYDEAERLFKRALSIAQRGAGGKEDAEVGKAAFSIGRMYVQQKRYDDAAPYCKQAIEHIGKTLGPRHPYYALAVLNYAALLEATGYTAEADKLKQAIQRLQAKMKEEEKAKNEF